MWFPGTNFPKPSGIVKRPGIYRARSRPRGATTCFAVDGCSTYGQNEIYTGKLATGSGTAFASTPCPGGWGPVQGAFAIPASKPAQCSVEAVIFTDNLQGPICCINEGTSASGTYDRMLFLDNGANLGKPVFQIYDGATKLATSPTALAVNTLHHLCGTSDGTNIRIYVDGQLMATTATSNGGYTGFTNPCFQYAFNHNAPNAGASFTGHVLFMQFATVAWSASEVRARAQAPYGHLYQASDYLLSTMAAGKQASLQSAVSVITG